MKCHACNKGTLHQKTKSQVFTHKGKSIKLEQPGLWCDSCEEGILDGEDIMKTEKAFEAFKVKNLCRITDKGKKGLFNE